MRKNYLFGRNGFSKRIRLWVKLFSTPVSLKRLNMILTSPAYFTVNMDTFAERYIVCWIFSKYFNEAGTVYYVVNLYGQEANQHRIRVISQLTDLIKKYSVIRAIEKCQLTTLYVVDQSRVGIFNLYVYLVCRRTRLIAFLRLFCWFFF